jgi:hypothetical protein
MRERETPERAQKDAPGQVAVNSSWRICTRRDTSHSRRETWRVFGSTSYRYWIVQSAAGRREVGCTEGPGFHPEESCAGQERCKRGLDTQNIGYALTS